MVKLRWLLQSTRFDVLHVKVAICPSVFVWFTGSRLKWFKADVKPEAEQIIRITPQIKTREFILKSWTVLHTVALVTYVSERFGTVNKKT